MHANVKAVAEECTQGSDEERLAFPEVVMKLAAAGFERYHADLVRDDKIYYLPDGDSVTLAAHRVATTPAMAFSASGVDAAVRAIQGGKIKYREFCDRIAQAGCVGYVVSIAGRRAVYYGRTGEMHIEPFPAAP